MTIQERAARAVELKAGCNCAQAGALAFAAGFTVMMILDVALG